MYLFKYKKTKVSIGEIIDFIDDHRRLLSQKCRTSYDSGNIESGRWWDCQACAMLTLIDRLKEEYKEN